MNVYAGNQYSEEELKLMTTLQFIVVGLSVTGCLFVITTFVLFKRLRSTAMEYVVMLLFSNLL
jgi:hypothetical protein